MTESRVFQTLTRGLDHRLPPMRLWRKSKRFGIWDPASIDFTQDLEDWKKLSDLEREVLMHLTCLFQAGEESVTLDLLPLIQVVAEEGRLEEEMYLTSFLFEEAKHVEAFRRFLDEVVFESGLQTDKDLSHFEGPNYRQIFHEALPTALRRLREDSSPVAQAEASVTYNMIVEGVLAETGYHAYYEILIKNEILPGMQKVVGHLKNDESRHLAYGVFLLSRLVAEHGDDVWNAIEARMGELMPFAIGSVNDLFGAYDELPFGLDEGVFVNFAMGQFQKRFQRIERARQQTLEQVLEIDVGRDDQASAG